MTQEFLDFIKSRQAIRSFTGETIPKEDLLAIAEAEL